MENIRIEITGKLGGGKTTIAWRIARALAVVGDYTVIVDDELREVVYRARWAVRPGEKKKRPAPTATIAVIESK